jgi:hypothetical protein
MQQKWKLIWSDRIRRRLFIFGAIVVVLGVGLSSFFIVAKEFGWKEASITFAETLHNTCGSGRSISTQFEHKYFYRVDGVSYSIVDCASSPKSVLYLPGHPSVAFLHTLTNSYELASLFIGVLGVGLIVLSAAPSSRTGQ